MTTTAYFAQKQQQQQQQEEGKEEEGRGEAAVVTASFTYYGFQTVCKCPFWALLVTLVTDSNQTWAN